MIPFLAQIFMGWPAILGSLALSSLGIARREARWLFGGAALTVGFAWYLTGSPNPALQVLGYGLPLLHVGGGIAVHRGRAWVAWTLLLPHALIALLLAVAVLTQ